MTRQQLGHDVQAQSQVEAASRQQRANETRDAMSRSTSEGLVPMDTMGGYYRRIAGHRRFGGAVKVRALMRPIMHTTIFKAVVSLARCGTCMRGIGIAGMSQAIMRTGDTCACVLEYGEFLHDMPRTWVDSRDTKQPLRSSWACAIACTAHGTAETAFGTDSNIVCRLSAASWTRAPTPWSRCSEATRRLDCCCSFISRASICLFTC